MQRIIMYRHESWTYPSQYRLSHEFIQGLTTTDTKILYKLQLEVTQLIAIGYKSVYKFHYVPWIQVDK